MKKCSLNKLRRSGPGEPIHCGFDAEFGQVIAGIDGSAADACELVLSELRGVPWQQCATSGEADPSDSGRRTLLEQGYTFYREFDLVEGCTNPTAKALDATANYLGLLKRLRLAAKAASQELEPGQWIQIFAGTHDGADHHRGHHRSFRINRQLFDLIMAGKTAHQHCLRSFQAAVTPFLGQGEVKLDKIVPFVLSDRANITVQRGTGPQTMEQRPQINSRDEALSEELGDVFARLHCIAFDANLCQVSVFLSLGLMQLFLAQSTCGMATRNLCLDDDFLALHSWNSDPTLKRRNLLADGVTRLTIPEFLLQHLEEMHEFAQTDECKGPVPDAEIIISEAVRVVEAAHKGDRDLLFGSLDWYTKLRLLQESGVEPGSYEAQAASVFYGDLSDKGLFSAVDAAGGTRRIISEDKIENALSYPPEETRAWCRTTLLRRFPNQIKSMDWDFVEVVHGGSSIRVDLADVSRMNRSDTENLFSGTDDKALLNNLHSLGRQVISESRAKTDRLIGSVS